MDYKFTLSTDSTADLYDDFLTQNHIYCAPLSFFIEKGGAIESHLDDFKSLSEYKEFYDKLRHGAYSRTSMLNYESHYTHFLKLAKNGARDVVHFTISSGLSPTVDVANAAAKDIKKDYPEFNVFAIDTLTASLGQGTLVKIALKMRNENQDAKSVFQACEKLKHNLQHFIIASDLHYLRRGGRVSGTNAILGTILSVKPLLTFDVNGKLSVIKKIRGYKKAFAYIQSQIEKFPPAKDNFMTIIHTDFEEKAKELKLILEEMGYFPEIYCMGPIIGSHMGPDSVSVGYVSKCLRKL